MPIGVGDLVSPATSVGSPLLINAAPAVGRVDAAAAGPPPTLDVLWEDGSKADGVSAGSLRKLVGAQPQTDALPAGRVVRALGPNTAQEALFFVFQAVGAEDDAGAVEVLVLLIPITRPGELRSEVRLTVNVGPVAGAVAAIEVLFGNAANGFKGALFEAQAGDDWPRY